MVAAVAGLSLGVTATTYYSRLAAAVAAAVGRRDASFVRTPALEQCQGVPSNLQPIAARTPL